MFLGEFGEVAFLQFYSYLAENIYNNGRREAILNIERIHFPLKKQIKVFAFFFCSFLEEKKIFFFTQLLLRNIRYIKGLCFMVCQNSYFLLLGRHQFDRD